MFFKLGTPESPVNVAPSRMDVVLPQKLQALRRYGKRKAETRGASPPGARFGLGEGPGKTQNPMFTLRPRHFQNWHESGPVALTDKVLRHQPQTCGTYSLAHVDFSKSEVEIARACEIDEEEYR